MTDDGVFTDVLALASPSSRMSKRSLEAAKARLTARIFAPYGGHMPPVVVGQPSEKDSLLAHAARLCGLADRGMKPRAYRKAAAELIARANKL